MKYNFAYNGMTVWAVAGLFHHQTCQRGWDWLKAVPSLTITKSLELPTDSPALAFAFAFASSGFSTVFSAGRAAGPTVPECRAKPTTDPIGPVMRSTNRPPAPAPRPHSPHRCSATTTPGSSQTHKICEHWVNCFTQTILRQLGQITALYLYT